MSNEPVETVVRNTGDKFAAFVQRYNDVAVVSIFRRLPGYRIDFSRPVSSYETLGNGASRSARKEIRRLEIAEADEARRFPARAALSLAHGEQP